MKLTSLNYVDAAEKVIKNLRVTRQYNGKTEYVLYLTTSKIRNLLAMVSELYNEAIHLQGDTLPEDLQAKVQYFKMRLAYEVGRDKKERGQPLVRFVENARLMEEVSAIGDQKQNLILFCRYMEALVAYHKYYEGKD